MKKIILMFALIMGFAVNTMAQKEIVDNGTAKDNWFVTTSVGTHMWGDTENWGQFFRMKNLEYTPILVEVGVGKMFTPFVGAEINYGMMFVKNNGKFLDAHNLTANAVFNLSNILCGYNGHARKVEFDGIVGTGWVHVLGGGDTIPLRGSDLKGSDNISLRGAIRMNWNAWKNVAITVTPEVTWLPNVDKSFQSNILLGVRWNIPSKRGGFPMKKLFDQKQIDDLNATINKLNGDIKSQRKQIDDLMLQISQTSKDNKVITTTHSVAFEKGKYEVGDLSAVAEELVASPNDIVITATTSPEGSETFNKELAFKRANAVKDALVKLGVNANRITVNCDYAAQRSASIILK